MDLTSSHQRTAPSTHFQHAFLQKLCSLLLYSFGCKMCDKVCDSIHDAKCVIRFVTAFTFSVYSTYIVRIFCTVTSAQRHSTTLPCWLATLTRHCCSRAPRSRTALATVPLHLTSAHIETVQKKLKTKETLRGM